MATTIGLRSRTFTIPKALWIRNNRCFLCRRQLCTVAEEKSERSRDTDVIDDDIWLEPIPVSWWVPRSRLGITKRLGQGQIERREKKPREGLLPMQQKPFWTPPPDQTVDVQGLKIPRKKKRDSLSILNALSSTVKRADCGLYDYMYIEDRSLYPITSSDRVSYIMARASGRRTARYMVNRYRNTFDTDEAQPPIPAFLPIDEDYKCTEVGEEALLERIERRNVKDAIEVYIRMKEQALELTEESRLRLLELLCVFGCNNPREYLFGDERVTDMQVTENKDVSMNKAIEVFDDLTEKTAESYNWIIRGLAQAKDPRCGKYLHEIRNKKLPVSVGTYNELIAFCETTDKPWNDALKHYNAMKSDGVSPNQETFHSMLKALSLRRKENRKDIPKSVPSILAEMMALGFRPTLETWSFVMEAISVPKFKGTCNTKDLREILEYLEKQDPEDVFINHEGENFFQKAMNVSFFRRDSRLGIHIYDFMKSMGPRYRSTNIGKESTLQSMFFQMLCYTEPADVVMKYYHEMVPGELPFSSKIFDAFFPLLESENAFHYVPDIWRDLQENLQMIGQTGNFFSMVSKMKGIPQEYEDKILAMPDSVLSSRQNMDVRKKLRENEFKTTEVEKMYSNSIKLYLKFRQLEKAWNCFRQFAGEEKAVMIERGAVSDLLWVTLEKKDAANLMSLYDMPDKVRDLCMYPLSELIMKKRKAMSEFLSPDQMDKLEAMT